MRAEDPFTLIFCDSLIKYVLFLQIFSALNHLYCYLLDTQLKSNQWILRLSSTFKKLRIWHLVPSLHNKEMWEKMETVTDFVSLGSKITVDGDCSHEIKRCLLLWRKAMTNLDSVLKTRDITLPTQVCIVKAMVFPVVMYGCESWTIDKAEHRRTDAFKLCWKRLGQQGDQISQS